ncbi:hypothetical protein [Clostridium gasigenes]|uniref:Uncharacterized protein n=1 Tax=Clostridium gasigenes TaxID=94869 RepID=A0A7X0SGH0_9CLOT|nr:hypothetical protein [Clostridium gasigenes]MBB6715898.1 hypothetical protein [Clostridium gasigenes]
MFYKDNLFENKNETFDEYEFSSFPLEEMQRIPQIPGGFTPNFQPPNFPGGNFPSGNPQGGNVPGVNVPGVNINPSQLGAPPNFIPNQNDKAVKSLTSSNYGGPQSKFVSQNSIKFCLFQFTYIWERGGRNYWAFLLNVDRVSVSGLRWFGRRWAYFGVDLRRIDSFVCFRNKCESCLEDNLSRQTNENGFKNTKKLYTNSEVRESVSKTLVSLNIPETKDDFIVQPIGIVEGKNIENTIPSVSSRNTQYTIELEVMYPETLDETIKDKIIEYANEACEETVTIINATRGNNHSVNPLETFNDSTKVISKALAHFSSEFNSKLRDPKIDKDIARSITYSITQGKTTDPWKTI